MEYQYKLIVSNRLIYREFEIPTDMKSVQLGTTVGCEFRLNPENFFLDISVEFIKKDSVWELNANEGIYISRGDMRKLMTTTIKHGDVLSFHYSNTDELVFLIRFQIDFEATNPNYNWKINLSNKKQWIIGDTVGADLFLNSKFSCNNKMILTIQDGKWFVSPISAQFGINVNGKTIKSKQEMHDFDFVSVSEFFFYFKNGEIYFDKEGIIVNDGSINEIAPKKNDFIYPKFTRNTRLKKQLSNDPIALLDPPQQPKKPEQNIVMMLMPAIGMLALTVLVRGVMSSSNSSFIIFSACSMSMGIITTIVGFVNNKRQYKKESSDRIVKYNNYIAKKTDEIISERVGELQVLDDTYFDLSKELRMVYEFSEDLFDRNIDDDDFLDVCIGRGKVLAARGIDYKKQEKFETDDELANIPEQIEIQYKYIENAPIHIRLIEDNAVGVVGTKQRNLEFFKKIILDISVRQHYSDVEIVALVEDDISRLEWLRLLPNVNGMFGVRNIVCDNDSKTNLFEAIYKELLRRQEQQDSKAKQLVILVMEERGLKNHPLSRFIEKAAELNCTFVFFEQCKERVPLNCDEIIWINSDDKGVLQNSTDITKQVEFTYEVISDADMEFVARKLAPVYCEKISLESSLRKNYTLYEMLGIYVPEDYNLEQAWGQSRIYESMAAPLGINAKNEIVSLNLHEKAHGPHGLVAGTTGSGKSEILQSYILSAALKFHPYEIGFVIIDFKGGGMVNQFRDLPHLIGAITNIDGREIDRSLKSIKAELVKRQTLFAEADVNHIDKYIKLYKEKKVDVALPHLVIIVDEFAELKAEQPEFMKELISTARIGRSLGVHLILATQKPAGQVNEQIWSNSKFKLCLKVQNQEDSKEVLKSPLAAEIKEPGRAYLQVGNNEIFELFQSAYSGGPSSVDSESNEKKFSINQVSFTGYRSKIYERKPKKGNTKSDSELEAIVKYIAAFCEEHAIERLPGICLPSLMDCYNYDMATEVELNQAGIVIPMGIYDDPDNQSQLQVNLNVSESNTFILGASQFGKTCMLQTIIRGLTQNYTPDDVNIYILDFASMALKVFDELQHVGGVVVAGEDDKLKLFFKMMLNEVKERKAKFSEIGITSYLSYREAGYTDLPQIVILVDNFIAFRELCEEYSDAMLNLCREGVAVGLSVIVTAQQTTGLGYKYLSTFGNKYGFSCNEKSEYGAIFDRCRIEPKNVPGRGLTLIDKNIYEFQTFLSFDGEKEIDRVENIKKYISEINDRNGEKSARRIPEIPKVLTDNYLKKTFGNVDMNKPYIGIDYDTVEPVKLQINSEGYMAILGKENAGKLNYIKYLFENIQKNIFDYPVEAYVVDSFEQRLGVLKEYPFVENYTTDSSYFEVLSEKIEDICKERQEKLQQGQLNLSDEPLIVVVVNNSGVYDTSKITKEASTQWKNMIKQYRSMKMLFIMAAIENGTIGVTSSEILKHIKETRNILYFDELATIKVTDVPIAMQRQFKQNVNQGDAFWITKNDIVRVKTPLHKEE